MNSVFVLSKLQEIFKILFGIFNNKFAFSEQNHSFLRYYRQHKMAVLILDIPGLELFSDFFFFMKNARTRAIF